MDLFEQEEPTANVAELQKLLLEYAANLAKTGLSNNALGPRSLPSTMDPEQSVRIPDRLTSLLYLVVDTCSSLLRFPFFFLPLVLHLPLYIAGRISSRVFPTDPESFARQSFFLFFPSFLVDG